MRRALVIPTVSLPTVSFSTLSLLLLSLGGPAEAKERRPPTLVLEAVRAEVVIEDAVISTRIEQVWRNPGAGVLEVDALLPVPPGGAVTEYAMEVGGEPLAARLLPVAEARQVYLDTVRRIQDPALLKHAGDGALRARAFPVPPGEARTLTVRLVQTAAPLGGILRHAFLPSTDRPEHDRIGTLEVRVHVRTSDPLVAVWSPSHEVTVRRTGPRSAEGLHRSEHARAGDPVLLAVATSPGEVGLRVLMHRTSGEAGTFLLLGAPTGEATMANRAARTLLFVFDRSGSMRGQKIEQVRGALRFCLSALDPRDRFNLITFNDEVHALFPAPRPGEPAVVAEALAAVETLEADRGTNILGALERALDQVPAGESADIVFLTDGLPTAGETDPARLAAAVRARNEGRARLFAFGVGDDVNVPLLDRLALDARGLPIALRPAEDVELAVSSFFAAITTPTLTHLALTAEGATLSDVYPRDLPDLFRGATLTILGRFEGAGPGKLVLEGSRDGARLRFPVDVEFPEASPENAFLPALWATRHIGHRIDDVRARGPEPALVDEIVALARRYGVVSEYTAFLLDLDTEDPAEMQRRAVEAFERAATVEQGAWAQSQVRSKEEMKRALAGGSTTRYEDDQGRVVDLSDRVARIGETVLLQGPDGTWVDTSLPRGVEAVILREESEAYDRLVASNDAFARVAALGAPILVRLDGAVIHVQPAAAEPGR